MYDFVSTFLNSFIYLFERESVRERETEREKSFFFWFSPQVPITTRAGTGWTQEPRISLSLPRGWHGPTYLSHQLPPLSVCLSRKLEWEPEPGFQSRHSDMGCRFPPISNICAAKASMGCRFPNCWTTWLSPPGKFRKFIENELNEVYVGAKQFWNLYVILSLTFSRLPMWISKIFAPNELLLVPFTVNF